jgi:hypothetical protein
MGVERMSEAECDQAEREWDASALEHSREMELRWMAERRSFAWIDPAPCFMVAADWSCLFRADRPKEAVYQFPVPCGASNRIMRLTLLGGGQLRSTEQYREYHPDTLAQLPGNDDGWYLREHPTQRVAWLLRVTADCDGRIVVADGHVYEGAYYEKNMQAVVLRLARDQPLAERAAATLRLIDSNVDNLLALFDPSEGCGCCGRALQDPISKLLGIGPR